MNGISETGQPGPFSELLRQLVSESWHERQVAVAALVREEYDGLAAQLLHLIRQDHTHLNVLSPVLQVLGQAGRPLTSELIELLNSSDRELRVYVPIILGALGGPHVVQALSTAAASEEQPENVRFNAIEALGSLRAVEAVENLREILKGGSPYLQYGAIVALGQIRPENVTNDLLPFLEDEYLAEPAILALGQAGEADSAKTAALISRWLDRPTASVGIAIAALGNLARRSTDPLVVRLGFFNGLSNIGTRKLLEFLQEKRSQGSLNESNDIDVVIVCGWLAQGNDVGRGLGSELQKSAIAVLVELLGSEMAQEPAETVLAEFSERILPELTEAVYSPNSTKAQAALRLIAKTQTNNSLPLLLAALQSDDQNLARLAAEELGKTSRPEAVEALWEQLYHSNQRVQTAIGKALIALRPADLPSRARELFQNSESALRSVGLSLLAASRDPDRPEIIQRALGDPAADVRQVAVHLLPEVEGIHLVERLEPLLKDNDPDVRRAVIRVAARLAPQDSQSLFIMALRDVSGWVRMEAVRSLAQQADPTLLPILLQQTGDPLPPVRLAAVGGLIRLQNQRLPEDQQQAVREKLIELGDDDDEQVRNAVRQGYHYPGSGGYE